MNKFYSFLYMFCVLIIFAQINSIKITSSIQKSISNINQESPVDGKDVFLAKEVQTNDVPTGINVIQVTSFGVITISDFANIDELVSKLAWTKCSFLYGNSKYTSQEKDKAYVIVDLIDKLVEQFPSLFSNFNELVERIKNQAGSDGYQESYNVVLDNFVMAIVNFLDSVKSEVDSFKYSELIVYLHNILQLTSHPTITSEAKEELLNFKDLHLGNVQASESEGSKYYSYKELIQKQKDRHERLNKKPENRKEESKVKPPKREEREDDDDEEEDKPKVKKNKQRKAKREESKEAKEDDNEESQSFDDDDQDSIFLAKDEQATLAKDLQATLAIEDLEFSYE